MLFCGAFALWSAAAFLDARFVLDVNDPPKLPTQSFFQSGAGRVLDLGAGTGRSSIMILRARPHATLVALDLFGESFDQHFGKSDTPQQRLMNNLKAAGVDQRVTVERADMRMLPFEDASFDAIVSAYAIDHLNRNGIERSLAEAARVMKPGGEILLMLVGKEPWGLFAFGPVLMHAGGIRNADWWTARLGQAGFQVIETGTRPATLYVLARRSSRAIPQTGYSSTSTRRREPSEPPR